MEEKVLAKGERYNVKWLRLLPFAVVLFYLFSFLIDFIPAYIKYAGPCSSHPSRHALWQCSTHYYFLEPYEMPSSALDATLFGTIWGNSDYVKELLFFQFIPILAAVCIIFFWLSKYSLVVTDKRIYGQTAFGRRVDLPVDTVSSVGLSLFKGIAVGTSSGRVGFLLIKNRDELHTIISNLIIERQSQVDAKTTPAIQQVVQSDADEIKKYKELLDMGVITQEEFDAKKKQLLGL